MDRLLVLLSTLEQSDITPREFLTTEHWEEISEIEYLLERVCITSDGSIDHDVVETMRKKGYPIYPVERDSFGWLIGGVLTTKGTITFG